MLPHFLGVTLHRPPVVACAAGAGPVVSARPEMWHDGSSSDPVMFLTKMGDAAVLESDLLGWK
eukprot:5498579-Alexandrium_andersonii.AAC.1